MTDDNLVEQLVFANAHSPRLAPNGTKLSHAVGKERDWFIEQIFHTSGSGSSVLLLVLDQQGRRLTML